MLISIIIPFYKGEKYLNQINEMINNNVDNLSETDSIELILVNDSPELTIDEEILKSDKYSLKVITNNMNSGIHQSRINGIKASRGQYILMLDQDDQIANECVASQISHIEKADVIVSNGYKRNQNSDVIIYGSSKQQKKIRKLFWYIYLENRILSPGQCLIKKDAIPTVWMESAMKENGADDMLLWLIMLYQRKKFTMNKECLYIHVSTGENVSNDNLKMADSTYEMLKFMNKSNILSSFYRRMLKRKIDNDVYYCNTGRDKYLDYKFIEQIRKMLSRTR